MELDVLETRPTLLRRLRHRLHHQVVDFARGRVCDALCGQVAQGFGPAERTVPGAERGHDAGTGPVIPLRIVLVLPLSSLRVMQQSRI